MVARMCRKGQIVVLIRHFSRHRRIVIRTPIPAPGMLRLQGEVGRLQRDGAGQRDVEVGDAVTVEIAGDGGDVLDQTSTSPWASPPLTALVDRFTLTPVLPV